MFGRISWEGRENAEWLGIAVAGALAVALFLALSVLVATAAEPPARADAAGGVASRYARLPLAFEKNEGQFNQEVKFVARGPGYTMFLTGEGAVLSLASVAQGSPSNLAVLPGLKSRNAKKRALRYTDMVRLQLLGANPKAEVVGTDELPGKVNYFIGNNPAKWRRNIPTYGKVKFEDVYPGIDLVYYGNQRRLEYDLVVAPGADPNAIRLAVVGEGSALPMERGAIPYQSRAAKGRTYIAKNGDLVVRIASREVRFRRPVAYQNLSGGRRRIVPVRYVLRGKISAGFEVGAYDRSQPLVIDPVLDYSTYLGGTAYDYATGVVVDSSGNAYLTGYTTSTDLPVVSAFQKSYAGGACNNDLSPSPCFDAFVAKLNAPGTALVYSTYLGGSGDDRGTHMALDSSGDAYVAGYTDSTNFPTASSLQGWLGGGTCGSTSNPYPCFDAFLAKLDPTGSSLIYSTYLGGGGDDYGFGLALDSAGEAFVTGFTSGSNFPVTGGAFQVRFGGGPYDAFAAKIKADGSGLVYSTLLGGSGEDRAAAIAVDSSGNAYVTGQTNSTNFPALSAFQPSFAGGSCGCFDAFVSKLNASGSAVVYSTYLGGTGGNYGNAIALDTASNAYVAGWTTSSDFPVTSGAYQKTYTGSDDAFITKLSAAGNSLVYSTYLGGIDPEVANGIAVDGSGNAYVTGQAYGVGFPAQSPLQAADGGFYDAFVASLNTTGSGLIYATWLGGSGNDYGSDIAVDSGGNVYVAGGTFSTDFPTTPGAFETAYAGGAYDAFVAKVGPANAPGVSVIPNPVTFGYQEVGTTSTAQSVKLMDAGSATLDISKVSASGDFAVSNNCGGTVAGGANCKLSLTFEPTAIGARAGALTLTDNAAGSPQTIPLSGIGTSGAVSFSSSSLNFGSLPVNTTSSPVSVTLSNVAQTTLYISSIKAEGNYAESDNCGTSVTAGGNCTLTITFTPTAPGTSVGQILMTDSAPASPQSISLTGVGTAPVVSLSPTSLSFGSQLVGTASAAETITLSNTGNATLSIASLAASGDFAQTNSCGTSLAAGASCTISVTFTPTATGTRSGTVTIADNAAGSPQSVAISGTGVTPAVSFSPTSLNFGNVNQNTTSAPQGVTLLNSGTAILNITKISVSGDFAETSGCAASLPAGSSCTINVTFTPTTLGTLSGTLAVSDNAPGSPQTVSLTGNGADPSPVVTLTPTTLSLNNQGVGTTSAAQPVTLTNTGTATLNIAGISASGDFSETSGCGSTLEVGQSCSVSVFFKPSALGTRTGSLTFTDNAADSPQTVGLSGTGVIAFALAAQNSSVTVVKGTDQTSFLISASSAYGFGGQITLGCSGSGAAVCAFSPASIATGQTSTLTLSNLAAAPSGTLTFDVTGTSGSQVATLPLTVRFADFSVSVSPSSGTVSAGQVATYQLTLTPVNGFDFPVSVACSGAPAAATCSDSPASLTLNGSSGSNVKVSVTTTARSSLLVRPQWFRFPPDKPLPMRGVPLGLLAMLWALMVGWRLIQSGSEERCLAKKFLLPILLTLFLCSCGGGGGAAFTPSSPSSGTPAGTYRLTINAESGSLSHSATVTLVVN